MKIPAETLLLTIAVFLLDFVESRPSDPAENDNNQRPNNANSRQPRGSIFGINLDNVASSAKRTHFTIDSEGALNKHVTLTQGGYSMNINVQQASSSRGPVQRTRGQQPVQQGHQVVQQNYQLVQQGQPPVQRGQPPVQQGNQLVEQGHKLMRKGHKLAQQGHQLVQQGNQLVQQGHHLAQQGNQLVQQGQQLVQQGNQLVKQGQRLVQQGQSPMQQGQPPVQQGQQRRSESPPGNVYNARSGEQINIIIKK